MRQALNEDIGEGYFSRWRVMKGGVGRREYVNKG